MSPMQYILRKLGHSLLLILGVTLISFMLMVYYGPDKTYDLLGKNPTQEQIDNIREQLGYNQGFIVRYGQYLKELVTLDFGFSDSSGERVNGILSRTLPISLALVLPGFIIGNLLGILLGLKAAHKQGELIDRLIMAGSVFTMSISFLVIIISLQVLLCTPYGINLFPARGWSVTDFNSYIYYVTIPTVALVMITLGYNTRFYRAVFAEEMNRPHILTLKAYGASPTTILLKHTLKNGLVPVLTRVMFSLPMIIVSSSLLLETYFGIPGIGKASYDAMLSGDQPLLKAIITLTAVLFILVQLVTDLLYRWVDPRVSLTQQGPA